MVDTFYVGFPTGMMACFRKAVPFEVLEENGLTLRVKLLEDVPAEGTLEGEVSPKAGTEFVIENRYNSRGQSHNLLDYLRQGNMAPWYASETTDFAGCIYPTRPND